MWCLPASEFLLLSKLRPHEELLAEGKLVQWDASRTTVFYVSHQWTSTNHPDYSTDQLRTFQSLLLRMIRGTVPETAPTFVDAVRLPSNVKISTQQWQTLVQDAVVWMDYLSVRAYCCCHTVALSSFPPVRYSSYIHCCATQLQIPQIETSAEGELSDREKANRSISAYIERSSHFFVLCPSVSRRDNDQNDQAVCNYGSWLESGDCRVELSALLLARNHCIPAIVRTRTSSC